MLSAGPVLHLPRFTAGLARGAASAVRSPGSSHSALPNSTGTRAAWTASLAAVGVACGCAAARRPAAARAAASRLYNRRVHRQAAPPAPAVLAAERIRPDSLGSEGVPIVGVYEPVRPGEKPPLKFARVSTLGASDGPATGEQVWVRARLSAVRVKGKTSFAVLRENSLHTVQCVKFKSKEDGGESATLMAKFFKAVPLESLVDVRGTLVEASVSGCTQSSVELQMDRAYVVSRSVATLPFLFADAQRGEEEIVASQETDRPYVRVLQEPRLDSRWLDLRVPGNNGIMRVKSTVSRVFRDTLAAKGFVEIQSPKLIGGESEGGAEVFRTDYFGKQATLAQSPQLYKQMAMSADLPGVYEVGPVFRAENSNTNRHLCEFTGLDLEMPIDWHYDEVIAVIHETLLSICEGIETQCADVLPAVRKMYPSEPPKVPKEPRVIHWPEAMEMLAAEGIERNAMDDLSTEEEKTLGRLVLEKFDSDLFFLDRYPSCVRPFYTMPNRDEPEYSNSYDVIFRGQEIGSGAQRCHDPELLEARCEELGVPTEPLQAYIDSFRHGVPPHGGVGLGLERIVQLYLGLDNIRKAAMFTRDPARLSP